MPASRPRWTCAAAISRRHPISSSRLPARPLGVYPVHQPTDRPNRTSTPGGASSQLEPIDAGHEALESLYGDIANLKHSIHTEADTRLKVIDRVLQDVLLWPLANIFAEPATLSGFVDYSCTMDGRSRLIVEAKNDDRPLGCQGRQVNRGYKLRGGVFTLAAAKEGINQAIRYCGEKNAELACVTNGHEWIVFRGNRLGDGTDTREGVALVFPDLEAIQKHFNLFYNLLSYEASRSLAFRPYFQAAEGQPVRLVVFHKALRPQGSAKFRRPSPLATDLGSLLSKFFDRLTGEADDDLPEACFVETKESQHADHQLARIAESLVRNIRDLQTAEADELTRLIKNVTEARRHEFVVIVGTKGSGKSTFISRFFHTVIPKAIAKELVVIKLDLKGSTGDGSTLVGWLDDNLLAESERSIFTDGVPTYDQLRGIFFDSYTRLKSGTWAKKYEQDPDRFRMDFGEWMEDQRQRRPHDYIEGMLRFVVKSQQKVPVIIFDNADHFDIDFQQSVYQYARSIYEKTICLIVLPITDRTSWQLSKHGAIQSFDHQSFFLPTPSTDEVIRKRIEFLEERIANEAQRPEDRYFLRQGIYLSITDIANFTRTLQRVFLQTSLISADIGDLANHDVRRALHLTRNFATSPHLKIEDLISAYVAGTAVQVPRFRAVRALVRGQHDIYPVGQNDFVQNLFALHTDIGTTPLLGVRILQLLADAPTNERNEALLRVDQITEYFASAGVDSQAVAAWLDAMIKTGLCLSYDPTVQAIESTLDVEVSPAGRLHLRWALDNSEYISAMSEVTPLRSETTYELLREADRNRNGWRSKTVPFLQYLLAEDASYCTLPTHESYEGQARILRRVEGFMTLLARELSDTGQSGGG
jgi:GTPase SAR1 family protein